MAKSKGIFKIQGKLEGYVHYRRNGKDIVQMPGGFDGARIKTEERYEKTRQLATEFGKCASLASLFKRELAAFLEPIPDPYVYNWIQQRMTMLKTCDVVSPKGEKTVGKGLLNTEGKMLLDHFSFNRSKELGQVLFAKYSVDLDTGILRIPAFYPTRDFGFGKGMRIGGLQLVLMRVDFEACTCEMTSSDLVVFNKIDAEKDLILPAELPLGKGMLIVLLFVGSCEVVNDTVKWYKNKDTVLEIVNHSLL
jgi:hypothetical protein